jgi:hypothetical protein
MASAMSSPDGLGADLVAKNEPTRMRGNPRAIPAVKCSPRSTTPSRTATAGLR